MQTDHTDDRARFATLDADSFPGLLGRPSTPDLMEYRHVSALPEETWKPRQEGEWTGAPSIPQGRKFGEQRGVDACDDTPTVDGNFWRGVCFGLLAVALIGLAIGWYQCWPRGIH